MYSLPIYDAQKETRRTYKHCMKSTDLLTDLFSNEAPELFDEFKSFMTPETVHKLLFLLY